MFYCEGNLHDFVGIFAVYHINHSKLCQKVSGVNQGRSFRSRSFHASCLKLETNCLKKRLIISIVPSQNNYPTLALEYGF